MVLSGEHLENGWMEFIFIFVALRYLHFTKYCVNTQDNVFHFSKCKFVTSFLCKLI